MENTKDFKRITKNYIYNLTYQVFLLIMPFVTTPYVSRVLGENGNGIYSFSYTIASYFVIFGALGFNYYSQRLIAQNKENKIELKNIFWSIVFLRFITVTISLIIFFSFLICGFFAEHYQKILYIMSFMIVSLYFDISFFFQGRENFGQIVIRNIFIKSIGIALIFAFVKTSSDLWIYTLIQCSVLVLSNLSLWLCLPKYMYGLRNVKITIRKHILPMLKLFIPTIAGTVFTMMDRILIGLMVPGAIDDNGILKNVCDIENGMYDQAEKIVKMGVTVLSSLGVVMIPHNSSKIAEGDYEGVRANIYKSFSFVFMIGVPMFLGLMAVSTIFCPWFFGEGYVKVPTLIMIFSPLILIMGISNIYGVQYLIPMGKDTKYMIAICIGALINLVLDLIFIPLYYSYGAAIATVCGELSVATLMGILSIKEIKIREVAKRTWKALISGSIMFLFLICIKKYLSPTVLNTIILIFLGMVFYFLFLVVLKENNVLRIFYSIIRRGIQMMRRVFRKIFYCIMNPRINRLVYDKTNQNSIIDLKNKYYNKRCFIIGNGPSLSLNDLECLKDEYTFAANKIYKLFDKTNWRPTFLFCQDPTILRENAKEFSDLEVNKIIVPTGEKKCIVRNAIYIKKNSTAIKKRTKPSFSTDIRKEVYDGFTVAYSMIQVAAYMGFKEIYLIGMDCNYNISGDKINSSSYADPSMKSTRKTALPDYEYWFMSYEVAKDYCDRNQIRIANCTNGGKLEVFERIDFRQLERNK